MVSFSLVMEGSGNDSYTMNYFTTNFVAVQHSAITLSDLELWCNKEKVGTPF
jgi:hypothetical protein